MRGGLDPDELEAVASLLRGLKAYDVSLKNICMFGSIKKGSSKVAAVASTETGLLDINPARVAIKSYFGYGSNSQISFLRDKITKDPWRKILGNGRTLGILVPPAHKDDAPMRRKFTEKDFSLFSKTITDCPRWRKITGKILEIDVKDRTLEIHTSNGAIVCQFPEDAVDESLISLVKNTEVIAEVFCSDKPKKGAWTALNCNKVMPAPKQDLLLEDPLFPLEIYPPGVKPPKKPMTNGFNLEEFAPSLDEEAGENLAAFLRKFKGC